MRKKPAGFVVPETASFVPMALLSHTGRDITRFEERPKGRLTSVYFEDGDLLLARITPCFENGKQGIVRGVPGGFGFATTEVYPLACSSAVFTEYLAHYLRSPAVHGGLVRAMAGATGRMRVPQPVLEAVPVPIPPLAEQRRIVAAIDERFSRLDAADDSLMRAQRTLMRLWASVVAGAVAGDWPVLRLTDVTESQMYGTSARASRETSGVPVLRMSNIQDGRIDFTDLKYLPQDHAEIARFRLSPGDLVFNRTNSPELVGKSAVFTSGPDPTVFASYLIRVRLTKDCDPRWAALVINSELGRQYVASVRTQQVGQANVNGTKLAALPIPLPPLEVQQRLLDKVDEWTARIQVTAKAVKNSCRRSALLRRSILAQAFVGKLVLQDPFDEPASVLLKRIEAQRASAPKARKRRNKVPA